ncbi:MAG: hypothetical protein ACK5UE_08120 [Chitinophagales bacterium]
MKSRDIPAPSCGGQVLQTRLHSCLEGISELQNNIKQYHPME